jgi:hypothetical protein
MGATAQRTIIDGVNLDAPGDDLRRGAARPSRRTAERHSWCVGGSREHR